MRKAERKKVTKKERVKKGERKRVNMRKEQGEKDIERKKGSKVNQKGKKK